MIVQVDEVLSKFMTNKKQKLGFIYFVSSYLDVLSAWLHLEETTLGSFWGGQKINDF